MSARDGTAQGGMNAADVLLAPARALGLADRAALLSEDREITYGALEAAACQAGGVLRSLGVAAQDRVLLLVDDSPEFFFVYLGAMKIGAVPVALNLRLTREDLVYFITDSACRALVADPQFLPLVEAALRDCEAPPRVILSFDPPDGAGVAPVLADLMQTQESKLDSTLLRPDDMALWMYTSGTTGVPKAAVHLQKSIPTVERYLGPLHGVGPGDRIFSASKLFFAFSLGHCLLAALRLGATTVLHRGWPAAGAVTATIERTRPSVVFCVPTMYRNILAEGLARNRALGAVRLYVAAGERLPEPLFRQWQAATGRPILEGIGSTETLMMFLGNGLDDCHPGATGKPLPGAEVRLLTREGAEAADPGQPGVLHVRCPSLAAGYWRQEEKTAAAFCDGWYDTGDVFQRDAAGCYHHQGRADDMLKISGQWVSPAEIEEEALKHPGVAEAAVVGAANADGLERLALCLVANDRDGDHDALKAELTETLISRLSVYKCPRRFVFLDEMPQTATGKVQRFRLRGIVVDRLRAEQESATT